ncbi:hypothetical protein PMKS-002618 [Pichia membranifaciens]|uniref:Uncharacterized protein n=1 Tax=Pichia membranifaciens TaxID=4926 RepID=A0A1Q2YHW2_9ASCO|nr:hypothetical protein PMKS-002618 [Pichia membranifaciens]
MASSLSFNLQSRFVGVDATDIHDSVNFSLGEYTGIGGVIVPGKVSNVLSPTAQVSLISPETIFEFGSDGVISD